MSPHEQMLLSILDCRRVDLYTKQVILSAAQEQTYREMQARFEAGEPLQYILGSVEFMGLNLQIDKRVLIPRPETELMVDTAISTIKEVFGNQKIKILDLGTGSGNIAISLAAFLPQSEVIAVDVSIHAIALAMQNAKHHHVFDRVRCVCEDMTHYLASRAKADGPFDVIVSNPPYIRRADLATLPADVQQEPRLALDGGEDGYQFYRHIVSHLETVLNPAGMVMFEVGDGQANEVKQMIEHRHSFAMIQLIKDFSSTERIVLAARHGVHQMSA